MTATESRSGDAPNQDLIYQLEDRPGPLPATFAAIQHVLASFVGVITPTLIIGGVLGLGDYVPYLVSMALFVSGIGTFIQAKRVGPIGAGMLCLQGTSFGFLSVILAAGFIVKNRGGSPEASAPRSSRSPSAAGSINCGGSSHRWSPAPSSA